MNVSELALKIEEAVTDQIERDGCAIRSNLRSVILRELRAASNEHQETTRALVTIVEDDGPSAAWSVEQWHLYLVQKYS